MPLSPPPHQPLWPLRFYPCLGVSTPLSCLILFCLSVLRGGLSRLHTPLSFFAESSSQVPRTVAAVTASPIPTASLAVARNGGASATVIGGSNIHLPRRERFCEVLANRGSVFFSPLCTLRRSNLTAEQLHLPFQSHYKHNRSLCTATNSNNNTVTTSTTLAASLSTQPPACPALSSLPQHAADSSTAAQPFPLSGFVRFHYSYASWKWGARGPDSECRWVRVKRNASSFPGNPKFDDTSSSESHRNSVDKDGKRIIGEFTGGGGRMDVLKFDNSVLRRLPVEDLKVNFVRQVPGACFSRVDPSPLHNPVLVCWSDDALKLLGLNLDDIDKEDFEQVFSGARLLDGAEPSAHCYCGYQFGNFAGQLGDGAAIYLGEVVNSDGSRWEMQLKGAGKTPYSRTADGRKVLRSSIREFLCSEALASLGIPTTRAGSCITSDTTVLRDINYDGHAKPEKASVVLRIARTFLRFGSFEIWKPTDPRTGRAGPSEGRIDILKTLTEFVIDKYYPHIWSKHHTGTDEHDLQEECVEQFYEEVVERTAKLVSAWQCVGWCHGVLNTDNMSIIGDTIDYGPYGFMEAYNPNFICNASDTEGRYSYKEQPSMCRWNCRKLAEALQPLMPVADVEQILKNKFDETFDREYLNLMRKKLGLLNSELPEDKKLVDSLLDVMAQTGADWSTTFRSMKFVNPEEDIIATSIEKHSLFYETISKYLATHQTLLQIHRPKTDAQQLFMLLQMARSQPMLLDLLGIDPASLASKDKQLKDHEKLQQMSADEYRDTCRSLWTDWLSQYVKRLSVDATAAKETGVSLRQMEENRHEVMDSVNPKIVLRNYMAQRAIDAAEGGDFSEVRRLTTAIMRPFDEDHQEDDVKPQDPDSPPLIVS
eukprot:GHVQ01032981.1.p1 GENE.GHVQ01032981.1~~GHVQ01032981.1.p1  ORF type:complete len:879 (+),score=122.54 GHVQ01032981.1:310-2946(+)